MSVKLAELLASNVALRTLTRYASLPTFRRVARAGMLYLLVPPARRDKLRQAVASCFEHFFPSADVEAYLDNYLDKLAEDLYTLNLATIERLLRTVEEHVVFDGREHFLAAHDREAGILAVGAHVGSITLGSGALMSLHRQIPEPRRRVTRICMDPEVRGYPNLIQTLERSLRDYRVELRLLVTHRDPRQIAAEICGCLEAGGMVTTNLDVMVGGRSQRAFPLFDGRVRVQLPALVGAAKAALRVGATVLPWVPLRQGTGLRVRLEPPIGPVPRLGEQATAEHPEVQRLCEQLRARLEGWITAQPEQWTYWDRLPRRVVR